MERGQLAAAFLALRGVGVRPCVQLDRSRPQLKRGLNLPGIRIDEERNLDSRVAATRERLTDSRSLTENVQSPFGRQFLASLGDESDLIGADLERECNHPGLDGQLEVEPDLDRLAEQS